MFSDDVLFPSPYYNNETFPAPTGHEIEISSATIEEVKDPKTGTLRPKVVLRFAGLSKGMILNRTNYTTLATAFGRDGANWIGKRVAVQRVPVVMAGATSMGIRFLPVPTEMGAAPSAASGAKPF
jgi:hypothetical protein